MEHYKGMDFWEYLQYHWGYGVIVKLILNLILVPIPEIGVTGAAWASVACHAIAFTISIICLRKAFRMKFPFKKFVLKPILATIIMAICSYFIYSVLSGIIAEKLATILAIVFAALIYGLSIVVLKIFTKDEIKSLPGGNKICFVLEKLKIY